MSELPTPNDPRLNGILEFWNTRRGIRRMPGRRDFDTLELRQWLGHLILVGLDENGSYRYRVHGTVLADGYGADLTGRRIEDVRDEDKTRILGQYRTVSETGSPLLVRYERFSEKHGLRRVERLLLPLSSDGTVVDRVLSGAYYSRIT